MRNPSFGSRLGIELFMIIGLGMLSSCSPSQPAARSAAQLSATLNNQSSSSPSGSENWPGLPENGQVTNHFVYVSKPGQPAGVLGYQFDAGNDSISPLSFFVATDQHIHRLTKSSDGRFVYGINFGTNQGEIYGFKVDPSSGTLSPLSPSVYKISLPTDMGAADAALGLPSQGFFEEVQVFTIGGQDYLYASNYGGDQIYGFKIDSSSGALSPIPGSPFATPKRCTPADMGVTPDQRFFYTACQGGGILNIPMFIAGYSVNSSNGTLSALPDSPFPAPNGSSVYGINISPNGQFLYSEGINNSDGNVGVHGALNAFDINTATGSLTTMNGSPFEVTGYFPIMGWTDPSGSFLYVLNILDAQDGLELLNLNSSTGAVSNPSFYQLNENPNNGAWNGLDADPDGLGLFLVAGPHLYGYARNSSDGTLSPLAGSPQVVNSSGDPSQNPIGITAVKIMGQVQ